MGDWSTWANRYLNSIPGATAVYIMNQSGVVISAGPDAGLYEFDSAACQNLMNGKCSGGKSKLQFIRNGEAHHYDPSGKQKCDDAKPAYLYSQGQNAFVVFNGYESSWKVLVMLREKKLPDVLQACYKCTDKAIIPDID